MKKVGLFETVIKQESGKCFKIAVLRANVPCDPSKIEAIKAEMEDAVSEYVGTKGHNTFVEEHPDTPNLRIIISDLNDIDSVPFDGQTL